MCPDRQILSVYFDGELPSPWKEKMASHLERCPECRARLETYRALNLRDSDEGEEARIEAARDRVWQRLRVERALLPIEGGAVESPREGGRIRRPLWRRKISIPLPAAAAAAGLIVVLFVSLLRVPPAMEERDFLVDNSFKDQTVVPISNMEEVLRYFDARNEGDFVLVHLPESKQFMSSGDPTYLRASEHPKFQKIPVINPGSGSAQ
jgi:hypothetical protein